MPARLTDDQAELVAAHVPYALRAAGRAKARWPLADLDELEGWALEGLCHAARNYDPARGASFRTWAFRSCFRACIDGHRAKWGRHGQRREELLPVDLDGLAVDVVEPPLIDDPGPDLSDVPWLVLVWAVWDRRFRCHHCGAVLTRARQRAFCGRLCQRRFDAGSTRTGPRRAWVRRQAVT